MLEGVVSRNITYRDLKLQSCTISEGLFSLRGQFVVIVNIKNMIPDFNSLPEDRILDWSKLKQIADDILKCI